MRRWRGGATAVAVSACIVLVAGVALALSQSERRFGESNDVEPVDSLGTTSGSGSVCQRGELVPRGTAAVRVSMQSTDPSPPPVRLSLRVDDEIVAEGSLARADWRRHEPTVPLEAALPRDVIASVCLDFGAGGAVRLGGRRSSRPGAAGELPGRLRLDYVRTTRESWWTFAPIVAHRLGFAHPWRGPSVAALAIAATCGLVLLTLWCAARLRT